MKHTTKKKDRDWYIERFNIHFCFNLVMVVFTFTNFKLYKIPNYLNIYFATMYSNFRLISMEPLMTLTLMSLKIMMERKLLNSPRTVEEGIHNRYLLQDRYDIGGRMERRKKKHLFNFYDRLTIVTCKYCIFWILIGK